MWSFQFNSVQCSVVNLIDTCDLNKSLQDPRSNMWRHDYCTAGAWEHRPRRSWECDWRSHKCQGTRHSLAPHHLIHSHPYRAVNPTLLLYNFIFFCSFFFLFFLFTISRQWPSRQSMRQTTTCGSMPSPTPWRSGRWLSRWVTSTLYEYTVLSVRISPLHIYAWLRHPYIWTNTQISSIYVHLMPPVLSVYIVC